MSLYADFIRERGKELIVENDDGFAMYRYIDEKSVYIIEVFVRRELRKKGIASRFADSIVEEAKAKGCTELLGTVIPSSQWASEAMKAYFAYGMTIKSASEDLIVIRKDI